MTTLRKARFLLHEATRKRLVRSILLVAGVLPSILLGLGTILYWSPYYQEHLKKDWQSRVTANLGVRVVAGQFRLLAPEQFVANDVILYHPETDAPMAKVRQVAGLIKKEGWSLVLDEPRLDASQLEATLTLLHDGFLCKPQTRERMLAISVPNGLQVHHATGATQIGQVEILMKPSENRSSIVSKFAYADQAFGDIQIQVVRDHSPANLSTKVELRSPKTWIACSNFVQRIPVLKSLGNKAQFKGVLRAQWSPEGWDAIVQGEIDRVEFAELTSPVGSPFKGLGAISFTQLNLSDGQILYAQGKLDCQQGSLQTEWIKKAAQWLELPSKWDSQLAENQSIDALSVAFELSPEGLRMQGQLPGPSQWPPVAMKLAQATLCTPKVAVPLTNLVAAVQAVPGLETPGQASVDLQAMHLASILPWPNTSPSETEQKPGERVNRLSKYQSEFEGSIR